MYTLLPEEDEEVSPENSKDSVKPFDPMNIYAGMKKIASQGATGFGEGLLSTYGDILDFLGLQSPGITPWQKERYEREFEASPNELAALSAEGEELPYYSRLLSSKDVGESIQALGLPEPEGFLQKGARRIGKFAGSGAAFGSAQPKSSSLAGVTGQSLEEIGAPPWIQALGEIIAAIKGSPSGAKITSSSPQVSSRLKELKKMGYSDADITLAKNSLEEKGWLKKSAKATSESDVRFKKALSNSESMIKDSLEKAFPGLEEGGLSALKENGSNVFNELKEMGRSLKIKDHEHLKWSIDKAYKRIKSNISNLPDEKDALAFLEESKNSLFKNGSNITAEDYIDWYQKLNKIGKWLDPHTKEAVLGELKENLKASLRSQGNEGAKVATGLEEANKTWMKYLAAEDVVDLMKKSSTEEGINFIKLSKSLQDPDNMKMLIKGLGQTEASNIRKISEAASSIKGLQTILEKNLQKSGEATASKLFAIGHAFTGGSILPLKIIFGTEIGSRIATKLLTDPSYQNLSIKLLDAVKRQSPNEIRSITEALSDKVEKFSKESTLPSQSNTQKYTLLPE